MRKIIVLTFLTLDGVMQAPGGPDEDTSGDFEYGGWSVPHFDEKLGKIMAKQMGKPFDLLLGRKTYDIFASYWPEHNEEGKELNEATKYVVSAENLNLKWNPSVLITGDVVRKLVELKKSEGPDLHVHGSGDMIQTLLKNDLVDEFWLKIYPLVLGSGKRLFAKGTVPMNFELTSSETTPSGVIVANYKRAGKVQTGNFS